MRLGSRPQTRPHLYADGFFEAGNGRYTAAELAQFLHQLPKHVANGWGFVVVRCDDSGLCARGTVPEWFMRTLATLNRNKTYIFLIEVVAQCLGLWFGAEDLGDAYWAFCDNIGALYSLAKGYTKELAANAFVFLFWHCVAEHCTSPWFEYVPSAAQVADRISRGDFDLPARKGWDIVDLELGDVWELLAASINEGGMAQWQHLRKLQIIVDRERCKLTT